MGKTAAAEEHDGAAGDAARHSLRQRADAKARGGAPARRPV